MTHTIKVNIAGIWNNYNFEERDDAPVDAYRRTIEPCPDNIPKWGDLPPKIKDEWRYSYWVNVSSKKSE